MGRLTLIIQIQTDNNRLLEVYDRISGGKRMFVYDNRVYSFYNATLTSDINGKSVELKLNRVDEWNYPEAIYEPYRGKDCLP